jgi:predicted nucleotidyltransferase
MNRFSRTIQALADRYQVFCFYAFGSRSTEVLDLMKGNCPEAGKSGSDIDIGVHYRRGHQAGLDESVRLAQELEGLFDSPVDLVDITRARLYLALDIIKGELIYCSDEIAQAEYELPILRRADDLSFYERERRHMLMDGNAQ